FSAVGLIFAWLTVIFWFPALARPGSLKIARAAQRYGASLARWPSFRPGKATAVVAVLFCAVAAFGWSRLEARDDIRLLQNPPKNLLDDQMKLNKLLDLPTPVQF